VFKHSSAGVFPTDKQNKSKIQYFYYFTFLPFACAKKKEPKQLTEKQEVKQSSIV